MNEPFRINWYRCKIDKKVMSELMKTSDARGLAQVLPQLGFFFVTGTLAYLAYTLVHVPTLAWSLPLLALALFVHGTFSSFLGMVSPVHELCHKTPFKTKSINEFFLKVYSFFTWTDYVGFRISHVKHHQVTTFHDHDGEVVLPQKFDWQSVQFFLTIFTCNPMGILRHIRGCARAARGEMRGWIFETNWINRVIPETNVEARAAHRRWAQAILFGHLALATVFLATGHWFLIVIFNFGPFYCGWLAMLCGTPQHLGMRPDVPDHRLCCRTYTCGWLPAFLYWNMQHHVEHHMFPAVPFYNLPKLRKAIEHDLPPAPHGLWATWKHMLEVVKKQREDPTYYFAPELPKNHGDQTGDRASDATLEREAASTAA
jgi:fatty acid desaturase